MSASDNLREVRDSLTRATTELSAAADRLEALESREGENATVMTPRWRRRDWAIAAASSLVTALAITLVGFAMQRTEPVQSIVVTTTSPPRAPEVVMPSIRPEPPAPPPVVVAKAPEPAPLPVVRPVAAKKPDAPSEPIRPARPRSEQSAISDVF